VADRNLLMAQRLAPDDLRQQFQPYAPDTLGDGSPDPNATAGWSQIYRDWDERGRDMPPVGDWLRGAGSEYANAMLMGSTAPGGRTLLHGTNAEVAGAFRPSSRGHFGPAFYATEQEPLARAYGKDVYEFVAPDNLFQAYSSKGTLHVDPAAESRVLSGLTDAERERVLSLKNWYKGDSEAFYQALSRSVSPERARDAFQGAGYKGIEGIGDGHEVAIFDPATIEILRKYGLAGLGLGGAAAAAAQQSDAEQ
jgi:hypothetical protein